MSTDTEIEQANSAPYCQAAVIVRAKDTDEVTVFALDHPYLVEYLTMVEVA